MRLPFFEKLYDTLGANILAFGYRGYGHSEGTPSEAGLEIDGEAIWDYVQSRKDIDQSNLYIMGRSLGGAVAIQLTEKVQEKVRGLILENTFTCISEMVDSIFPLLSKFKGLILKINWPSVDRIKNVRVPI